MATISIRKVITKAKLKIKDKVEKSRMKKQETSFKKRYF